MEAASEELLFSTEAGEALAQAGHRGCGCPILGNRALSSMGWGKIAQLGTR